MVLRTAVLFSLFVLLVGTAHADYPSKEQDHATIQKESGGNIWAIGDKFDRHGRPRPPSEWAYGDHQIRKGYITDVNRKFGTHYKSSDCLGNPVLSDWVYREYINMYATEKLLKHKPTEDDMSGIHNGGPNRARSIFTALYRWDVRAIRNRLKNVPEGKTKPGHVGRKTGHKKSK